MSSKCIIPLPTYTFRLRLSQIIIAILVLVLNVISIIILGGYGALGYGIFTPIATGVIITYWYYASYLHPQYYNRWTILILDCFAVIWWLSLWTVLAQWAATLGLINSIDDAFELKGSVRVNIVHALTAISAVLGAAEFVLFIISLVSFSVNLHRVRLNERQSAHQNRFMNLNPETNNGSIMNPQRG